MLVQVVPLFVGFAWFGVMIFGPYLPRFGSFSLAFVTLFCVWNGDALMDVNTELGVWYVYPPAHPPTYLPYHNHKTR